MAHFINSISINYKQRLFISSDFDMYCGGCDSIPFWGWLRRNQQFSLSVTCIDYDGEYLYSLQPNNVTDCFGEYLVWKGYQMYRKYINNIKFFFYEQDLSPFMKQLLCSLIYYLCIYCYIYIDTSIVRCPRVDIPRYR